MRVYGTDPDDPAGQGPRPGRTYAELCGGPLDGQLLDVTGMSTAEQQEGALLITEQGAHGPGGRADYALRDRPSRWEWQGDVP